MTFDALLYQHIRVLSVLSSPNSIQFATGDRDGSIRLWDVESGACLHALHGFNNEARSIVHSPLGYLVTPTSIDNTVRLWDAETGTFCHFCSRMGLVAQRDVVDVRVADFVLTVLFH
jgi:WD40 repeat protein